MKIQQKGRSMVEMLGVLAIIGVLSAGALAGYSKAMFRHKINQTIDIFQNVLERSMELEQKTGWEEVQTKDEITNFHILSSCQEVTDFGDCKLPVGILDMDIYENREGYGAIGSIALYLTDSKSCIAFASAGWENAVPIEWFYKPKTHWSGGYISIMNSEQDTIIYDPFGNKGNPIKSMDMSRLADACQSCSSEGGCYFTLVIRVYL